MTARRPLVFPRLSRRGLGNELFPLLRAADVAREVDGIVVPPRWGQIRLGPSLRRERDRRQYWSSFRPPTLRERVLRGFVEAKLRLGSDRAFGRRIIAVAGMDDNFAPLKNDPSTYLEYLRGVCRADDIPSDASIPEKYLAFHARLGDFASASDLQPGFVLQSNNQATPVWWFADVAGRLRQMGCVLPILVCSDGDDEQLRELLEIPGVSRSPDASAVHDLLVLAGAEGIAGSRSTFTAWGAFLGSVPLLVAAGGNAYDPHPHVWELTGNEEFSSWAAALDRTARL